MNKDQKASQNGKGKGNEFNRNLTTRQGHPVTNNQSMRTLGDRGTGGGNNLKVFFIRDAIKFPDFIHALKPDPVFNRQDGGRVFDFFSNSPGSFAYDHLAVLSLGYSG